MQSVQEKASTQNVFCFKAGHGAVLLPQATPDTEAVSDALSWSSICSPVLSKKHGIPQSLLCIQPCFPGRKCECLFFAPKLVVVRGPCGGAEGNACIVSIPPSLLVSLLKELLKELLVPSFFVLRLKLWSHAAFHQEFCGVCLSGTDNWQSSVATR